MSYLRQILTTPSTPVVKTHTSVESLIKSIAPINENRKEPIEPVNYIQALQESENLEGKELLEKFAEKSLMTEKDNLDIESINEEIEKDLKEAFLSESNVSMRDVATAQNYYKLYRDRDETFECKINVEGTSLANSTARLSLESDQWNIFFLGKIYRDGRCIIPLKKMSLYQEGTIGKARLEIIIDDTIFVPWEETFIVEGAKKVTVEIRPQAKVSVNLKEDE
jgi:hypothetical protein